VPLLLRNLLQLSSHRAFVASVALHGAGITAALLWLHPGLISAQWAGLRPSQYRSTVEDEVTSGPLTSPPLPTLPVQAEAPARTLPLDDADVEPVEAAPQPIADHEPQPKSCDLLTQLDWKQQLRPRPSPVIGETAPPPAPQSAPAQAAVLPSPLVGHNLPPRYPWVAWRRGFEGTVMIKLTIDVSGAVTAAEVAQSSGNELLDEAALTALREWRFEPAPPGSGLRVHTRPVMFVLRQ
jgi:TonB family protein